MSAKRLPVLLWLVGIIAAIVVITQTRFSADMSAFLPRSPSPAQQILVDQMQNGAASRILLIAIENAPTPALAALSKEFGKRLRTDTGDFGAVNNGDAAANDFTAMRDLFWRYRYALSPTVTPARFTADGLHKALENDLALLSSNMGGLVKETLPADPTDEILTLLNGLSTQKQPTNRDGVWFSPDGKRALLLAQTRVPGFDIANEETVLAKIETTFAAAQNAVPDAAGARLLLSGPGVFAVHTKNEMKEDISRLSLIATVLVAGILLLTYRSPRILVLAFVPVASGALVGIAAVGLGFGFVHGITLGFGVTLIGEAVDYAIYLFTQTAPGSSAHATLPRIWPMLQLGVLVSICGFSAMLFSSFTGFAQLGLFSITGLITAVVVTRWVLPSLLAPGFGTTQSAILAPMLLKAVGFARKLRWLLALVLLAAILALVFHRSSFWQDDLTSLSPIPASDQKLDQTLRADLAAPDVRYLLMTSAPDAQQALANSEKLASLLDMLRSQGLLAGYDAPNQYLPSIATQQARLSALPAPDELRARMTQALQDTPFLPDTFDPFIADAASAKTQPPLDRATVEKTPIGAKLGALLIQRGGVWTALLSLRGVTDFAPIAARIAADGPAGTMTVDLKLESNRLLETYRREAVLLALVGSLVIVALLTVALRSPRRIAVVVAPLAAAVLITTAILTAGGHTLSIFNLVGLLLTVAVGSNYCIFVERQDWRDANASRMLASLALANGCTIIGFGTLSFARLPVLHDIGMTVAIGTVLSLLSAAILTAHDVGRSDEHG
ncbi:MAG TPA: MMPL family transporter [Stellaceae bacterium]|nr:MMPL family transporter [Stellaceae bacterium]